MRVQCSFAFLRRMDAEVVAFHGEHLDAAMTAFLRVIQD
jgi:hypothetical protein